MSCTAKAERPNSKPNVYPRRVEISCLPTLFKIGFKTTRAGLSNVHNRPLQLVDSFLGSSKALLSLNDTFILLSCSNFTRLFSMQEFQFNKSLIKFPQKVRPSFVVGSNRPKMLVGLE